MLTVPDIIPDLSRSRTWLRFQLQQIRVLSVWHRFEDGVVLTLGIS